MEQLERHLRRVRAKNPSPMTFTGTNTYLLGQRQIAVIDPGPADDAHLDAILKACPAGADITHIFVTHSHLDHSPLARPLAARTGAEIYAFGDSSAGRSPVMEALAQTGLVRGGEGVDPAFRPDHLLSDEDRVMTRDWELGVIHTPGHFGNHISFTFEDIVFTGDHVMGWASSLVSPPDGDLTDFMTSCARLQAEKARIFHAGHGEPIEAPADRLGWLIDHRRTREAQIHAALRTAPGTPAELTARVYTDVAPALLAAAERNVLAHLIDLVQRGLARAEDTLSATARFHAEKA